MTSGIDIGDGLIGCARTASGCLTGLITKRRCAAALSLTTSKPRRWLKKFDAIICYDALHHSTTKRTSLSISRGCLRIGGVLFIVEGHKPPSGSPTEIELRGFMEKYKTLESPFSDYLPRA
jgi:2-polyprenyl-3-methyl-5-hydroxy-6-metoxy-1,4-benzoquinol methylase